MPVKIGSSYVSEMAYAYAQSQVSEESPTGGVLNKLSKQFTDINFSVGTQPFVGKGTNNISIAPNILRQMATDPEKRLEYETLIYDCNQGLKERESYNKTHGVMASGYIIDSDGGLRMWSISKSSDGKKTRNLLNMDEEDFKQRLAGRLPKKKSKLLASQNDNSADFSNVNEFSKYLRDNFNIVKSGQAAISNKYLRECLNDKDKRQKLFDNLKTADESLKSHEGEIGFQGMSIKIDENGEMTMMSSKSTVTFNEAKRARQIAAAQSTDELRQIMELLNRDLEECENGVKNNMCDETEVAKVKNMIERAQKQMTKLSQNQNDDKSKNFSIDIII